MSIKSEQSRRTNAGDGRGERGIHNVLSWFCDLHSVVLHKAISSSKF